jgi:predicted alpha/beta hydrolase family esterase
MGTSSFLIVHGIANRRPPDHWQFQLAATLAAEGAQVLYPGMPDPDAPTRRAWLKVLREELARMEGDERTVVCHSLACLLWMAAAPDLDARLRPDRVLLVSPPAPQQLPEGADDFRLRLEGGVELTSGARRETRIVASDADPYNRVGAAALYADPLGIEFDLVEGGGHITPAEGYGPWPGLVDWCRGTADHVIGNTPR